ncbi:hypothetical protein ANMWB30_08740 [Arthrobacter sp. MWB30]|nr:hypothetical protein ANMWB30_08740 [Arthrobacter sp. MWB30]
MPTAGVRFSSVLFKPQEPDRLHDEAELEEKYEVREAAIDFEGVSFGSR